MSFVIELSKWEAYQQNIIQRVKRAGGGLIWVLKSPVFSFAKIAVGRKLRTEHVSSAENN